MIEKVLLSNMELAALIIRTSFTRDGIEFFTPNDFSQQLGYMNRPKGYEIEPHMHILHERKVTMTQEVLLIKSGKVKINFYDLDKTPLESKVLETGDVILLANGGHGFEMLEATEMIEVKQGPYMGDQDKQRF